jgi:uncharacterized protein
MSPDDPSLPPVIVASESASPPPLEKPPGPWGLWATVGLSLVIALAYVLLQSVALVVYAALTESLDDLKNLNLEKVAADPKVFIIVTLITAPVGIGFCIFFAWLRKGISVREYLALRWPSGREIARWCALFVLVLILANIIASFIEGKATEDFMRDTLASMGHMMPLLWCVLVLAAPISEEFFFRGFLFTGLQNSRLGAYGAILITSILFAAIHLQYDAQGLIVVFFVGAFLAVARWKTNSLWLCVILHALMNLAATLDFMLFERG